MRGRAQGRASRTRPTLMQRDLGTRRAVVIAHYWSHTASRAETIRERICSIAALCAIVAPPRSSLPLLRPTVQSGALQLDDLHVLAREVPEQLRHRRSPCTPRRSGPPRRLERAHASISAHPRLFVGQKAWGRPPPRRCRRQRR